MGSCTHQDYCVSKVPLFSELSSEKLKEINSLIRKQEYNSGEIIQMEGQIGDDIYIIESGLIKLYKTSKDGKQQIIRLVNDGQFFGEFVLFKEEVLTSSAEAVIDSNVCVIAKRDLEQLIKTNADLSNKLLGVLTSRLNMLENKVTSLALEDAREKTMRLLLDLAQENGRKKENGILVDLPLSRNGLANLMGMSQETLSRKLSELQEDGIISIKGQKQVFIVNQ